MRQSLLAWYVFAFSLCQAGNAAELSGSWVGECRRSQSESGFSQTLIRFYPDRMFKIIIRYNDESCTELNYIRPIELLGGSQVITRLTLSGTNGEIDFENTYCSGEKGPEYEIFKIIGDKIYFGESETPLIRPSRFVDNAYTKIHDQKMDDILFRNMGTKMSSACGQ